MINLVNAEIVERKLVEPTIIDKTAQAYKYYIHFLGLDKRLDKWVTYEDIAGGES